MADRLTLIGAEAVNLAYHGRPFARVTAGWFCKHLYVMDSPGIPRPEAGIPVSPEETTDPLWGSEKQGQDFSGDFPGTFRHASRVYADSDIAA